MTTLDLDRALDVARRAGGRDLSRGSAIGSNGLVHGHILAAFSAG